MTANINSAENQRKTRIISQNLIEFAKDSHWCFNIISIAQTQLKFQAKTVGRALSLSLSFRVKFLPLFVPLFIYIRSFDVCVMQSDKMQHNRRTQ